MDCTSVRKHLADYSVGLVAGRRAHVMEQHLAQCQACGAELRALQRAAELVEMLPAQAPPEGLWDGLAHRLAHEQTAPARPRSAALWLRPAVGLAVMAAVALGIWQPWAQTLPATPPTVASTYVQSHLASAPADPLGGEISRGLVLAGSMELSQ
jgi:predicted anti-sigma-YlaC factor YlaD